MATIEITNIGCRVGGNSFPLPSEMQVTVQSFDGSETGRTGDGTMHRDYVTDKRRIDLTWKVLTTTEMAILLDAIDPATVGPKFTIYYPDPQGGTRTLNVYVGDRVAAQYTFTDNRIAFRDFSIALIQY